MSFNQGVLDKCISVQMTSRKALFTVAASQAINANDLVVLSSGGLTIEQAIALPGSNNTVTLSGGNLATVGIAAESIVTDAAGQEVKAGMTRTQIAVDLFTPDLRFLIRAYNATAANSQPQDYTIGSSYQYGRFRGASASEWYYTLSQTTSNGELRLVGFMPGQAVDANYAICLVRPAVSDAISVVG